MDFLEIRKKQKEVTAFIAGGLAPAEAVVNHLNSIGIKAQLGSYISYKTVNVANKNYIDALKAGVDYAVENNLKDITWVNAYNERQPTMGAYPVAYGSLNRQKFDLDNSVAKVNMEGKVRPEMWMHCGDSNEEWAQDYIAGTPKSIKDMLAALEAVTGGKQIVRRYNNMDGALELSIVMGHEEHNQVQAQVLQCLDQLKIFDKVTPVELNGELLTGLTKNYVNNTAQNSQVLPPKELTADSFEKYE